MFLFVLSVTAVPARGAERRSLQARALLPGETIVVDETIGEEVWQDAEVATDFIQQEPRDRQPATERTQVRVAYDRAHLYVAIVCDIDPARILTTSLARDFNAQDSDTVGMVSCRCPRVSRALTRPRTTRWRAANATSSDIPTRGLS